MILNKKHPKIYCNQAPEDQSILFAQSTPVIEKVNLKEIHRIIGWVIIKYEIFSIRDF